MLGVCYYPDHWPEAWWPADARAMRLRVSAESAAGYSREIMGAPRVGYSGETSRERSRRHSVSKEKSESEGYHSARPAGTLPPLLAYPR